MRIVSTVVAALSLGACAPSQMPSSFLIENAVIVDGTGGEAQQGSVRINGATIVAVGPVAALRGERVIDAGGLVLAPGFIDTHSHHDEGLDEAPQALAAVSQGITTIVRGQDGFSTEASPTYTPLSGFVSNFESNPAAINVASCAPHNSIRRHVLGDDYQRFATGQEVAAMRELVEADMRAGALALSTGLEYDPGIYASTDELVALASVAAEFDALLVSHIRSEDRDLWQAIDEIIEIARRADVPVQISHIKLAARGDWGAAGKLIARLEQGRASGVDITADIYPYEHWMSTATVLYPQRQFADVEVSRNILDTLVSAKDLFFVRFDADPGVAGRTLDSIARERGEDAAVVLSDLVVRGDRHSRETRASSEQIIARGMIGADVETLFRWPYTNFATDGSLASEHPRGSGSFPKVLGRYVREQGLLSLEEAVYKMTGLAADNVGITGRGRIAPGMAADLVLFDPETILDLATYEAPATPATGVAGVWVNGVMVFDSGQSTNARPGKIVRRPASTQDMRR